MLSLRLPVFITAFLSLTLCACGGGGSSSADSNQPGDTKHSLHASFINLLLAPVNQQTSQIDLFYTQSNDTEIEIAENVSYLQNQTTYSFSWEGLSQANRTFSAKDALDNQKLLVSTTIPIQAEQKDFFLLLTGLKQQGSTIKLTRLTKQSGVSDTFRFFHGNALFPDNIDLYNAATRQALLLNLGLNRVSNTITFDKNLAQTHIIAVPTGTTPNYTDTSKQLFQLTLQNQQEQHLMVLLPDSKVPGQWQASRYSD